MRKWSICRCLFKQANDWLLAVWLAFIYRLRVKWKKNDDEFNEIVSQETNEEERQRNSPRHTDRIWSGEVFMLRQSIGVHAFYGHVSFRYSKSDAKTWIKNGNDGDWLQTNVQSDAITFITIIDIIGKWFCAAASALLHHFLFGQNKRTSHWRVSFHETKKPSSAVNIDATMNHFDASAHRRDHHHE